MPKHKQHKIQALYSQAKKYVFYMHQLETDVLLQHKQLLNPPLLQTVLCLARDLFSIYPEVLTSQKSSDLKNMKKGSIKIGIGYKKLDNNQP